MLVKEKDSLQPQIDELKALLDLDLPANKRILVEKELKILRAGAKGEKDSAYYIDFQWRDSKNWAVLHDLRLEHRGQVAQIDHLLISRHLEMFVLESKHYRTGLKISESGEFSFFFNGSAQAIPSPQHRPASADYRKKFTIQAEGISNNTSSAEGTSTERTIKLQRSRGSSSYFCATCKKSISKKVAVFCFQNKGRFSGKAYCLDCQKALP